MGPIHDPVYISEVGLEEETEADEEPFYEELDPDFEDTLGAFKTSNPKGNRLQRNFIHVSNEMSKFRKTIETVLVVHGWETPAKTVPMTLIVLGVGLDCQAQNFRFESVRMWLGFYEDDEADPPNTEPAAPQVVAWAPFVQQEHWDEAEEAIEQNDVKGGAVGVEYVAKAEAKLERETKRSYTRKHFDRGSTDRLVHDDKVYGINWYCEQNGLQKYGVKPYFHIAVLLKRSHTKTNEPITFKGIFDMRVEAGFIHDFNEGRRRAFRLGRPEDDPVYYDPTLDDQVGGIQGSGQALLKKVKKDNLGDLARGQRLSSLLDPNGTLSGLEPLEPKKA
ncbi:hypothetical protein F4804DRAFT_313987 [Jackrogersella minutella]|nr:hypothetical protein F4804DRAFT_313987 [Jackrogersella minutella]